MNEPTAKDPWRLELGWTPDQNGGRISVMPRRISVYVIRGLLRAGESVDAVAEEFDLSVEQVRMVELLAAEAAEW